MSSAHIPSARGTFLSPARNKVCGSKGYTVMGKGSLPARMCSMTVFPPTVTFSGRGHPASPHSREIVPAS